ncbi:MAG: DHH family phosphoesterase [Planctomycetes bacterium]|nr:DHH family phosphoesterase [Planctomycetota bacterium]MBI3846749.1 DHH family phosphoesterase [Planctomycetota bacterium]
MRLLEGRERILVLTHDNPDPDAIASSLGIERLVKARLRGKVDLAYGGIVGRAENNAMFQVLRVDAVPLSLLDLDMYQAFVLVDTQPGFGNNSLSGSHRPLCVIDHHPLRPETRKAAFYDVRPTFGATATIVDEYLVAAGVEVDSRVATALFYGIKSETQDLGREATSHEARAYADLFPRADKRIVAQIERAPIPREYFTMMEQALRGTQVFGNVAVTQLSKVDNPDMIAEFADFISRLDTIDWSLCMGRFNKDVFLSLRTVEPTADAGLVMKRLVSGIGTGGGHETMAGGRIRDAATNGRTGRIERTVRRRFLEAIGVRARGEDLIVHDSDDVDHGDVDKHQNGARKHR